MADESRYFTLPNTLPDEVKNRGNEFYIRHLVELAQKCWDHHEKEKAASPDKKRLISSSAKQTLYTGSLGPCVYLRYRLATSPCFPLLTAFHKETSSSDVDANIKASRLHMLRDALFIVDGILQGRLPDDSVQHRVTLLEGELVGVLTMKILIGDAIVRLMENALESCSELIGEIELSMKQLLTFGETYVLSSLAQSECELLYGRCGFLKAIKIIQTEIGDPHFGQELTKEIVREIWQEGKQDVDPDAVIKNIKRTRTPLPLLWKWKGKMYLGACHGVTGILHTLLDFQDELISVDEDAMKYIEVTISLLKETMCTDSGNLSSSIKGSSGKPKRSDNLVQWCHGAPGHVLLLTQMARKTQDETYLEEAKTLTASVIQPRGVLRKGVGLCHGISGNAFSFLSVARAEHELTGNIDNSKECIDSSYIYANFALDNFAELESTPDRPYSLYEGMTGLSCLLLAIIEGGADGPNSKFPLYEV